MEEMILLMEEILHHQGCIRPCNPVNYGINYQPQLVQDFSHQQYQMDTSGSTDVFPRKHDETQTVRCGCQARCPFCRGAVLHVQVVTSVSLMNQNLDSVKTVRSTGSSRQPVLDCHDLHWTEAEPSEQMEKILPLCLGRSLERQCDDSKPGRRGLLRRLTPTQRVWHTRWQWILLFHKEKG